LKGIYPQIEKIMRKLVGLHLSAMISFGSCGPKPYYETHEEKKKLEHYNRIQFGQTNNR